VKRIRGVHRVVQEIARQLRRDQTSAEQILWALLRRRQLAGVRFRRQHPVGRYVLDFCAPALRLAIELDGEIHSAQRDQDAHRSEQLEAFGYRVIRFKNEEVRADTDLVIRMIEEVIEEMRRRPPPPRSPSPNSGGGG
jgi:very-short-patch-repair endonuclease